MAADCVGLYFQGSSVDQVLPLKYKWITQSPGANTTGAGSLIFNLLNQRQNLVFRSELSNNRSIYATLVRSSMLGIGGQACPGHDIFCWTGAVAVDDTGCSCKYGLPPPAWSGHGSPCRRGLLSSGAGAWGSSDSLHAHRGQTLLSSTIWCSCIRLLAGPAARALLKTGRETQTTTSSASVRCTPQVWAVCRAAVLRPTHSSQPATVPVGISQMAVPSQAASVVTWKRCTSCNDSQCLLSLQARAACPCL